MTGGRETYGQQTEKKIDRYSHRKGATKKQTYTQTGARQIDRPQLNRQPHRRRHERRDLKQQAGQRQTTSTQSDRRKRDKWAANRQKGEIDR